MHIHALLYNNYTVC